MKITEKLPNFIRKSALLLVVGQNCGKIYTVQDGMIELKADLHLPKPHYSDREGFFGRRGHGRVYGNGAVYENNKQEAAEAFLNEFEKPLRLIENRNFSQVYLFAPPSMIKRLRELLLPSFRQNIRAELKGNYCRAHPFYLLEKIAGWMQGARFIEQRAGTPAAAEKILRRQIIRK